MTENLLYAFTAQAVAYLAYAWALTGNSNRALAIVATRFAVGLSIATVTAYALARPFGPYLVPVAIASPIAWLVAGLVDPKKGFRRLLLYWVAGGTALTFLVNMVVLRTFLHAGHWDFG
jgi:hypothetical protein